MDLGDTAYKIYGPKKPLWKLMDLIEISSQVNGPLVHLTLFIITSCFDCACIKANISCFDQEKNL